MCNITTFHPHLGTHKNTCSTARYTSSARVPDPSAWPARVIGAAYLGSAKRSLSSSMLQNRWSCSTQRPQINGEWCPSWHERLFLRSTGANACTLIFESAAGGVCSTAMPVVTVERACAALCASLAARDSCTPSCSPSRQLAACRVRAQGSSMPHLGTGGIARLGAAGRTDSERARFSSTLRVL